jgi:hypothetical protein
MTSTGLATGRGCAQSMSASSFDGCSSRFPSHILRETAGVAARGFQPCFRGWG